MPRLEVRQLAEEDVYKDIVRVNATYRIDRHGQAIKEGKVCSIRVNGKRCLAVLRGYQDHSSPQIRMDDFTRQHRLSLSRMRSYDFEFEIASPVGQLCWALNATEIAYRLSTRIALIGLLLGLLGVSAGLGQLLRRSGKEVVSSAQTGLTSILIPVLSLVIAALAVFFGPLVTLRISRKQTELSRRIASKQIVAPMRQAWINDLRDKLAELSGSALHYWNAGFEDRTDKEYKRLELLEEQIVLRINPYEPDHRDLVASIRQMLNALDKSVDTHEFIKAKTRTTELGQKIFKTEWNRIKDDIQKP